MPVSVLWIHFGQCHVLPGVLDFRRSHSCDRHGNLCGDRYITGRHVLVLTTSKSMFTYLFSAHNKEDCSVTLLLESCLEHRDEFITTSFSKTGVNFRPLARISACSAREYTKSSRVRSPSISSALPAQLRVMDLGKLSCGDGYMASHDLISESTLALLTISSSYKSSCSLAWSSCLKASHSVSRSSRWSESLSTSCSSSRAVRKLLTCTPEF
jgi:hypothetical protein